ncbi:TonB-dependent receptor [Chitinophaga nivalis]|uniref:Outer membrane beta-barrel protein n=1 Tax=Chitinophaga nivalis TaxID=2991709 RepID=A0ABT3IID8_9BACT|nr:TonB-dependent receptor [Chitinophaga nivalis]MCW3466790.1 outer membrane beta-barrel protein [Chitinophaga nivalis]MCW3483519.1 outer membrane beta-barrel protein [Chitinophaga nivalis]
MIRPLATITILFCCCCSVLFAQRKISGTVYDKATRQPLAGASILLFTKETSILKAQTLSDEKGHFELLNPPVGNYKFIISFLGYEANIDEITFYQKKGVFIFNNVQLARNSIKLSSIDIKVSKPLFAIRKDTIEFDVSQIKTVENASLKNLMQKIPGLTIGGDGTYYFQGKPIRDLYIDGRAAFRQTANGSADPRKIAEIFLANMVEKIQVADKKSLDGISDPGSSEKVLNIIIKKEMKKGINGTVTAGLGTNRRVTGSGNVNMLRDNKQIYLMGNANNINTNTSFAASDESQNLIGRLPGINKNINGSTSIGMDISKKTKMNFNFSREQSRAVTDDATERENILQDSSFRYNNRTRKTAESITTSGAFFLDAQPDIQNKISIGVFSSLMDRDDHSFNNYRTSGKNNDLINSGATLNTEKSTTRKLAITSQYTHAFLKQGRSLVATVNYEVTNQDGTQVNHTLNNNFQKRADTINQQIQPVEKKQLLSASLSFTEPINKYLTLNAAYKMQNAVGENNQRTYDFDYSAKAYRRFNDSLTYHFKNTMLTQSWKISLQYNQGKIQSMLGLALNTNNSDSRNYTTSKYFRQPVQYFSPNFLLLYRINHYKSLQLNYSNETTPPTITQLMPVNSVSNPLYIELGNPDLKPSVTNRASLEYSSLDIKGLNFTARLDAALSDNAVAMAIQSDKSGKQVSIPVNVDGLYSFTHTITMGTRLKKSGITLNYQFLAGTHNDISYVNSTKNTSTIYDLGQYLAASIMYKNLLEIGAVSLIKYTGTRYSLQQNIYRDFLQYTFSLNINSYLPWNINVGVSNNYYSNTGAQQHFLLTNGWISKTMLPKKNLSAKLYLYDIFKENKNITTSFAETYIETSTSNMLSQYLMFSLTYYFGKKAASK